MHREWVVVGLEEQKALEGDTENMKSGKTVKSGETVELAETLGVAQSAEVRGGSCVKCVNWAWDTLGVLTRSLVG
jgi:hypothetical protein